MKSWQKLLSVVATAGVVGVAYWKYAIPSHRLPIRSELVTLGDLDGDQHWTDKDGAMFDVFTSDPSQATSSQLWQMDLNQNGLIDPEDHRFLRSLTASGGDPYAAEEGAHNSNERFPRPRELYRYRTVDEYQARPLWALPYPPAKDSVLNWLSNFGPATRRVTYEEELDAAIYSEAVRFDQAWRKREPRLLPAERDYASMKFSRATDLYQKSEKFELLLAITELVEDAETLTTRDQSEFSIKLLTFRDHLRDILSSPVYADFQSGKQDWRTVLRVVSRYLRDDLGLSYDFESLGPPRNLTNLENYLQRAEWQYYKSTARQEDFRALIAYAQHDPRYLRAVARTTRKQQDPGVTNHNLPMVLLFREALRIERGDKKKAAGLLDEAIRIPFGWVKSIPREKLPTALAYDNFLLPGNKEDGADKSRHWNVFGAISLYKTPQEALDLALKREMNDLRQSNYAEAEMREFLRDMIGNLNGMFHVITVNPGLLGKQPG